MLSRAYHRRWPMPSGWEFYFVVMIMNLEFGGPRYIWSKLDMVCPSQLTVPFAFDLLDDSERTCICLYLLEFCHPCHVHKSQLPHLKLPFQPTLVSTVQLFWLNGKWSMVLGLLTIWRIPLIGFVQAHCMTHIFISYLGCVRWEPASAVYDSRRVPDCDIY